jgi:restriction system protein
MPLFEHAHASKLATIEAVYVKSCMFCDGELISLASDQGSQHWERSGLHGESSTTWSSQIRRCKRCGWWLSRSQWTGISDRHGGDHFQNQVQGAAGCLKQLDVANPDVALDEIRAYLAGRYEARHQIDNFRFEEVVGSVYADLGYQAVVTNRRGDDGIDVFLRKGDETVGVQVKNYAGAIDVALIRELSGALVFNDLAKGIFVTTSRFTSGAPRYVSTYKMRGQEIELVDADAFYGALEIAQARHLEKYDDEIRALASRSHQTLVNEDRISF